MVDKAKIQEKLLNMIGHDNYGGWGNSSNNMSDATIEKLYGSDIDSLYCNSIKAKLAVLEKTVELGM